MSLLASTHTHSTKKEWVKVSNNLRIKFHFIYFKSQFVNLIVFIFKIMIIFYQNVLIFNEYSLYSTIFHSILHLWSRNYWLLNILYKFFCGRLVQNKYDIEYHLHIKYDIHCHPHIRSVISYLGASKISLWYSMPISFVCS